MYIFLILVSTVLSKLVKQCSEKELKWIIAIMIRDVEVFLIKNWKMWHLSIFREIQNKPKMQIVFIQRAKNTFNENFSIWRNKPSRELWNSPPVTSSVSRRRTAIRLGLTPGTLIRSNAQRRKIKWVFQMFEMVEIGDDHLWQNFKPMLLSRPKDRYTKSCLFTTKLLNVGLGKYWSEKRQRKSSALSFRGRETQRKEWNSYLSHCFRLLMDICFCRYKWWSEVEKHCGKDFLMELKYDGEHVIMHKAGERFKWITRNGMDFSTVRFGTWLGIDTERRNSSIWERG